MGFKHETDQHKSVAVSVSSGLLVENEFIARAVRLSETESQSDKHFNFVVWEYGFKLPY
jgi:hypothetical protein